MSDVQAVQKNRDIKYNIEKVVIRNFLDKAKKSKRAANNKSVAQRGDEEGHEEGVEGEEGELFVEPEENLEAIPRTIYLNNQTSEKTLDEIRDKMRVNQFSHLNFNPFYGSKIGRQYYKGVLINGIGPSGNVISRGGGG